MSQPLATLTPEKSEKSSKLGRNRGEDTDFLWQLFLRNSNLLDATLDALVAKQVADNPGNQALAPFQAKKQAKKNFATGGNDCVRNSQRCRTNFTSYQISRLEHYFKQSNYPDVWTRQLISRELDIHEYRVQVALLLFLF